MLYFGTYYDISVALTKLKFAQKLIDEILPLVKETAFSGFTTGQIN